MIARLRRNLFNSILGLAALAGLAWGLALGSPLKTAGFAVVLCYVAWRLAARRPPRVGGGSPGGSPRESDDDEPAPLRRPPADPNDMEALVDEMLVQGRYSLLLRPQIIGNLNPDQRDRARAALDDEMALVPMGEVLMSDANEDDEFVDPARAAGEPVFVDPFYLDRYPVTNRQYQEFVAAGGYAEGELWDADILPAVLDFVDSTGQPGPRYWRHGRFPRGQDHHPVVGVSWYEGAAYARWAGKRLATDAEWVKAGAWPVSVPGGRPSQRRYPWGNTMERGRANLWHAGCNQTVPVTEFAGGASVGGVHQLVGNVWEWTNDPCGAWDVDVRQFQFPVPMRSLRGGAFDTYFDRQATCTFESGDSPLARKHNIGFRCALGLCDLVGEAEDAAANEPLEQAAHALAGAPGEFSQNDDLAGCGTDSDDARIHDVGPGLPALSALLTASAGGRDRSVHEVTA